MDSESMFQSEMVKYLEACHMGEFLTGDLEAVKCAVDDEEVDSSYNKPTETLPIPPPPRCKSRSCKGCSLCSLWLKWKDDFTKVVDDILLRANVHRCSGSSTKVTNKKGEHSVGCRSNQSGTCKARFPRETFPMTFVDPDTGALNIKKGEPWLNTVTDVVTYLICSNTDITSLMSGTAVKAVVAYVSDYISKSALKTYTVFDSVCNVFSRNSELLGGTTEHQEKARRIMTQIVNSLTAKMEYGAPLACMYLLGNPDHYSSHSFKAFYWKTFVTEAQKCWHPDEYNKYMSEDNLMLQRNGANLMGVSQAFDYIYRSSDLDHLSLYDWVSTCEQKCLPRKYVKVDVVGRKTCVDPGSNMASLNVESDADSSECSNNTVPLKTSFLMFSGDHPLHKTHYLHVRKDAQKLVPNFIGPPVPRPDKGDREFYCSTMLALFKPWRSGNDLKSKDQSWDSAFHSHLFENRDLKIMQNMNVRYECLDARDDFSAQCKKDSFQDKHIPPPLRDYVAEDTEYQLGYDGDDILDDTELRLDVLMTDTVGRRTAKWNYDKNVAEQIMLNSGWLDRVTNDNSTYVAELHADVQLKKFIDKHQHPVSGDSSTPYKSQSNPNHDPAVKIVDGSYFQQSYKVQSPID
ncbi:hypothetical protein HYDPIDRAFT_177190 [Hydnomerulius pinastri MD-312]|uniref:Uncharacterized protein n=1 Tax=Hydnomerulius pinastri MD-312 TaxID=994086 RepID=A0A0C9W3V0_9AGAM|nr:hypothetical protein HYDPIDRAFT_177190 [Hydnomerulius pinastri MD-312]